VKLTSVSLAGRLSRRLRKLVASGDAGEVTYTVLERRAPAGPERESTDDERRANSRRRTRLRSGKVVDLDHAFIVECQVRERSAVGARLQLARQVELPQRIGLFDDAEMSIRSAIIVWRRAGEIGIRFTPRLDPLHVKESRLAALARQFYAVGR